MLFELRHEGADRVDYGDRVRARLALNRHRDAAPSIEPARDPVVLNAVDYVRHVAQTHRRAVAIRDDERAKLICIFRLDIGLQGQIRVLAIERTGGRVGITVANGGVNVVYTDAAVSHRRRIELHAHRVFHRAIDLDLRHAFHHRDALGDQRLSVFIDLRQRQHVRVKRHEQNRAVGWIDFAQARRRRHPGRQLRQRGRDRRLHVLRSGVNVSAQVELQSDRGRALRVGGVDRIDPGNA